MQLLFFLVYTTAISSMATIAYTHLYSVPVPNNMYMLNPHYLSHTHTL